MRIFGTDYMKLKIVRNNTRKETIICQSLTDSSVDYVKILCKSLIIK